MLSDFILSGRIFSQENEVLVFWHIPIPGAKHPSNCMWFTSKVGVEAALGFEKHTPPVVQECFCNTVRRSP